VVGKGRRVNIMRIMCTHDLCKYYNVSVKVKKKLLRDNLNKSFNDDYNDDKYYYV
jgi:hypothetical protein